MSTVAEQLRQAREARRLTVEQVAEITKIRSDHVRALEEGNFDVFSAPVYIRGFVRTLANLFRLEVAQVMAALDRELSQTQKFAEPPSLTGEPKGFMDLVTLQFAKVNWRKGALALGLAAVLVGLGLAVIAWRHYQTADPLKGLKPGVLQPSTNTTGETLPLPRK